MKKRMLVVGLAGLASIATGQVDDLVVIGGSNTPGVLAPGSGAYHPRLSDIWSNGSGIGSPNIGFFGAMYDALDDIDISGGVWDGVTGRVITQMSFGIGQFGGASPTSPQTADVHFDFYNAAAVDAGAGDGSLGSAWCNTTDILGGVAPVARYSFRFTSTGTGIFTYFTNDTSIALPDGINRFYLRWWVANSGSMSIWTGTASTFVLGFANNQIVGSTSRSIAFNTVTINTPPYFAGGCPARCTGGVECTPPTGCITTGSNEHRNICNSGAAGGGFFLTLRGESATCPPCAADYNQDGGVDGADLANFFPDWERSAPCADVNQDGGVDGADVEFFFVRWVTGEPNC